MTNIPCHNYNRVWVKKAGSMSITLPKGTIVTGALVSAFAINALDVALTTEPPPPTPPRIDKARYAIDAAPFVPEVWNNRIDNKDDFNTVQARSNCYAYALNYRSQSEKDVIFPQPGTSNSTLLDTFNFLSGTMRKITQLGAINDGLIPIGSNEKVPSGYYLTALFIKRGYALVDTDYHWYRLDVMKDGSLAWTHKPGGTPVTPYDDHRRTITDITKVATDYKQFGGYFLVPRGGINLTQLAQKGLYTNQEALSVPKFSLPPVPQVTPKPGKHKAAKPLS